MAFKIYYRKLLMLYILAQIDSCITVTDIVKTITVLHAIRWISQAWKEVREEIIKKCFRKAGILGPTFEVVATGVSPSEDPFCDLDEVDESSEIDEDLVSQLQRIHALVGIL